jgi:hypothetical protein
MGKMSRTVMKTLTVMRNDKQITTRVHISVNSDYNASGNSRRISSALKRLGVRRGFYQDIDGFFHYGRLRHDGWFVTDGLFKIE